MGIDVPRKAADNAGNADIETSKRCKKKLFIIYSAQNEKISNSPLHHFHSAALLRPASNPSSQSVPGLKNTRLL